MLFIAAMLALKHLNKQPFKLYGKCDKSVSLLGIVTKLVVG